MTRNGPKIRRSSTSSAAATGRGRASSSVSAWSTIGCSPAWRSASRAIRAALLLSCAAAFLISCAAPEKTIAIEERSKPIAELHPARPARCPVPAEAPAIEIVDLDAGRGRLTGEAPKGASPIAVPAVALAAGEWVALMKALECRATYMQALEALLDHYRAGHDVARPGAGLTGEPRGSPNEGESR